MNRPARLTLASSLVLGLVLGACSVAPASPVTNAPSDRPSPAGSPVGGVAGATADPIAPAAPTPPGVGNVNGTYPELSIELVEGGYGISVTDPAAKAWRIEVLGTDDAAGDGIQLTVEVGDVAPGAEARFAVDGEIIDVLEFGSMIGVDTAASGGCHPTLQVCVSSDDIEIDPVSGTLRVHLESLEGTPVSIQGATAGWPEEPFVLGPWQTAEPFIAG